MPQRVSRTATAVAVAVAAPLALSVALIPFRTMLAPRVTVLLFVFLTVAVSALGSLAGSAVVGVTAALCFDFFLTTPYDTIANDDPGSIVLLVLVSLAAGRLITRNRRVQTLATTDAEYLTRLHGSARLALSSTSVDPVIALVQKHLAEMLGLRRCRYAYEATAMQSVRLAADGSIIIGNEPWDTERLGMPDKEIELRVFGDGQYQGCFLLLPTPGTNAPLQARLTSLTLADYVGAALVRLRPTWTRTWDDD